MSQKKKTDAILTAPAAATPWLKREQILWSCFAQTMLNCTDISVPFKLHETPASHVMVLTEAVFRVVAIYKWEDIKGSLKSH